jgi:hypothetical protein
MTTTTKTWIRLVAVLLFGSAMIRIATKWDIGPARPVPIAGEPLAAVRADSAAFERSAREEFGSATSLAEDVALLLVARTESPALADELAAGALLVTASSDPRAARLRDAVFELWIRDARTAETPRKRLLISIVGDPQQEPMLRRRAAFTIFENAAGAELDRAANFVLFESDATVRADVMRGLGQNSDARAHAVLTLLSLEWSLEGAKQIANEPRWAPGVAGGWR